MRASYHVECKLNTTSKKRKIVFPSWNGDGSCLPFPQFTWTLVPQVLILS